MTFNNTGIAAQVQNLLVTPFLSWSRPIIVSQRPAQIVNPTSGDYNFAYPQLGPDSSVTYVPITGMCSGTIEYINLETDQVLDFVTADTRYIKGKQLVRVGVMEDGKDLFNEAVRIEFDGADHIVVAGPQPRDMYGIYSYDFWMQEVD